MKDNLELINAHLNLWTRSAKAGLEETVDEEKREKAKLTIKCIPRRRSSATSKHESKKCFS